MRYVEALFLPFVFFKVKIFSFLMHLRERFLYYFHPGFKKIDQRFLKYYRFKNPYRIYKSFAATKGLDPYSYGETPLYIYEKILKKLSLKKEDVFVELGFGRGRGLFFLSQFSSCFCIGYEMVDSFYFFAKKIKEDFLLNIELKKEDFFHSSLDKATVIYVHSTLFTEKEIDLLCQKILSLSNKPIVITTSFSLEEYCPDFTLLDSFEGYFAFGKTGLFFNVAKK